MKSVRRHELQTNVLADRLGTAIASTRPVAGLILGGLAVIVVAAIGYGVYSSGMQKANSEAWTEYYLNVGSGDAEAFNTVVEQFPSSSAAPWARQMMGDNQLLRGIEALYRNRAEGEQLIEEAIDSYRAVAESTNEPELRIKSSIGLAQAYESLGKIDDAVKYYQEVEKSGSQPTLVQMAAERAAWLRTDSSKQFYDWFATLKTTPDAPPSLPSNLSVPPMSPDFSFPVITPDASSAGAAATMPLGELKLPENSQSVPASPDSAKSLQDAPVNIPNLPPSAGPPALELPGSESQPAQVPVQAPATELPAAPIPPSVVTPSEEIPPAPKP